MLTHSENDSIGWMRRGYVALLAMLVLAGFFSSVSDAANVAGMYDAAVRVTDSTEATRQAAFATALGIVAARVSGQRDAANKLGNALNAAPKYVQRYGYNAGFIEVGFDSAGVNSLLEQAGLPLWGRARPVTLVVLPSSLQGVREARAAVEQTAKLRGVPLVWARAENSERVNMTSIPQVQALADRYGATAVLVARMTDPTSVTSVKWQLLFEGAIQEIQGSIDEGPHLAADVLGRYYAVADKESAITILEVAGIDGLDAYATTLNYLSGLSTVRNVKVANLQHDSVRFQLELRGGIENLRRGLELDQKLAALQTGTVDPSSVLMYRLNGNVKVQ